MRFQRGKVNLSSIIILVLIIYGGFVAFKFITVHITRGQIKTDVINRFGYVRGPDFSEEQGEKIIREILAKYGIISSDAKIEGDEYGEGQGESGGESSPENAAQKTGKKVIIDVRLDDNKRNIKFYIRYEEEVDLILFKSRQTFDIQEEMLNFN
jgi:hypothetical protein